MWAAWITKHEDDNGQTTAQTVGEEHMNGEAFDFPVTRRRFLALAGAALALPTIIPGRALGRADAPAPSRRITLGLVGCGNMGSQNAESFLGRTGCQVVAACDVDKKHLENGVNLVNKKYGNQDCKPYHDYRELMALTDIDAVMLALPDHWHELAAVEAARHKKDIYGEKPLARTIAEQQAMESGAGQPTDLADGFLSALAPKLPQGG